VSSACIACRRRKSKCDGNTPSCAACASVYHTECVYDLNSDHRRKGVYKKDIDNTQDAERDAADLIEAILNASNSLFDPPPPFPNWRREGADRPRTVSRGQGLRYCQRDRSCRLRSRATWPNTRSRREQYSRSPRHRHGSDQPADGDSPASQSSIWAGEDGYGMPASLEAELSGKLGALRLEEGQVRFIGATSNLMLLPPPSTRATKTLAARFEPSDKTCRSFRGPTSPRTKT
ncbi:hypothetical protein FN846DRAFT_788612, partial [Sphaerosporella brunnea]